MRLQSMVTPRRQGCLLFLIPVGGIPRGFNISLPHHQHLILSSSQSGQILIMSNLALTFIPSISCRSAFTRLRFMSRRPMPIKQLSPITLSCFIAGIKENQDFQEARRGLCAGPRKLIRPLLRLQRDPATLPCTTDRSFSCPLIRRGEG